MSGVLGGKLSLFTFGLISSTLMLLSRDVLAIVTSDLLQMSLNLVFYSSCLEISRSYFNAAQLLIALLLSPSTYCPVQGLNFVLKVLCKQILEPTLESTKLFSSETWRRLEDKRSKYYNNNKKDEDIISDVNHITKTNNDFETRPQ